MDAWLTAIAADKAPGTAAQRTIRDRPAGLTDTCWTTNGVFKGTFTYQGNDVCDTTYPSFGDTRTASGQPLADDVLKCALKPIDFSSYGVSFTASQQARLQAAFPNGVCDYTKPGIDQQPALGSWLNFGT
jgi:hypothetical protein